MTEPVLKCGKGLDKASIQATVRLFCLPYAGAGATVYRSWSRKLPDEIDVVPVQLPGRQERISETLHTQHADLVRDVLDAIDPYLDMPFAFFGHSLGALVSFSLVRELRERTGRVPLRLFVSGRRAPQLPSPKPPIYQLPDDEFIEEVRQLNGMPSQLLDNAEFMELILPILRADCTICDTYTYTPEDPLECPISAYGGTSDPEVTREDMAAWRLQTSSSFRLQMFPGDHFFLHDHTPALLNCISRDLLELT